MIAKLPKSFLYLLTAFFIINLFQAHFTELIYDEAYYWFYSQDMAWGYFDHPPMVALMIKISSLFFQGELGVRFVSVLMATLNLVIIWELIGDVRKKDYVIHYFVLVFSVALLNAYGFFTLPDTPLLFFTSCFLWSYKKFIERPNYAIALLLGFCMAALMYSKYHAVLVIFFVLLSNLPLVKNKYAWAAVAVALLAYTPHFYWLYDHDFVSIKYHLYERPNGAYSFQKYTLGFFVNLIVIVGLTFPFVYQALYKTRSKDLFEKALLYITYGVIIFFFLSSFNRRVQTQWIIVISIPLVILVYNFMLNHETTLKWIYRLGIANIVVILYLRLGLVYQPLLFQIYYETHGNKDWVGKLKDQVGDLPVVFENSYRRAPMYAFYSGGVPTFSLNNVMYRKNQYSLGDTEERVRGKRVAYISKYMKEGAITYTKLDGGVFHGKYIDAFNSYRKLSCEIEEQPVAISMGSEITYSVHNPYHQDIPLEALNFAVAYLDKYKKTQEVVKVVPQLQQNGIKELTKGSSTTFKLILPTSKKNDLAYFRIVISEFNLPYGLNGRPIPFD
jgi:hypothetical protein